MALHARKNRAWLEDLTAALTAAASGEEPLPAAAFARIWARATAYHGDFLRYQEILFAIIESNVTLERLAEFKRNWAEMVEPIRDILAKQCGISAEEALNLYLRLLYQAPALLAPREPFFRSLGTPIF